MPRRTRGSWHLDTYVKQPTGTLKRVLRKARINTRAGALAEEQSLHLASFTTPTVAAPSFVDLVARFTNSHVRATNGFAEQASKKATFNAHLVPAFGALPLDQITSERLGVYVAEKRATLAPKTVNNHLTMLRCALSCAVEWGLLPRVPRIPWAKVPQQPFDWFTFAETDRLLAVKMPEPYGLMVHTAVRTGLRLGELLGLRWEDIDPVRGVLRVERAISRGKAKAPKNGRMRTVPLAPGLCAAMAAFKQLRDGYVFGAGDRPLTKGKAKRPVWDVCRLAGLRRRGWHTLRHTFASHLVSRGVAIKTVQELLGHSTLTMTLRYAHLAPETSASAVALLEEPAAARKEATG